MLPYRYTSNESLADAADCAKALGVRYDIVPIAPAVEGFLGHAREDVRRPRARRHRGERAEPRARHGADGDLQQVRRHGDDHRQQERDVGRLRHALRRHERRLQSDQGPLQDGGLPPGALAQRARAQGRQGPGRRGDPARTSSPGRRRRSCARTRPTRIRCRPTRCWTTSSACLVEREMPLADIVARGHAPEIVKKVERLLYLAEYKRRQAAPGVKISARNFGRDRRYPITNKFREALTPPADAKPKVASAARRRPARRRRRRRVSAHRCYELACDRPPAWRSPWSARSPRSRHFDDATQLRLNEGALSTRYAWYRRRGLQGGRARREGDPGKNGGTSGLIVRRAGDPALHGGHDVRVSSMSQRPRPAPLACPTPERYARVGVMCWLERRPITDGSGRRSIRARARSRLTQKPARTWLPHAALAVRPSYRSRHLLDRDGRIQRPSPTTSAVGCIALAQISIFSAISIASSTSMPRYRTVLSIFEWPNKS